MKNGRGNKVIGVLLVGSFAIAGCGGTPMLAQQRCKASGLTVFGSGKETGSATYKLDFSASKTNGAIKGQELRVQLGTVAYNKTHPEAILRLYGKTTAVSLMDVFANKTVSGPLKLKVLDATHIHAGSQNRTDLSGFGCDVDQGTICAQVGLDTTGDHLILNDDKVAFNAASGTVTITGVDNSKGTISLNWSLNLGPNILAYQDKSSGKFAGCLQAKYTSSTDQFLLK